MKALKVLLLTALLSGVFLLFGMKNATPTNHFFGQYIPPITYKIEDKVIHYDDGSFKCRMYELMVTNHTEEALYVTGSYHVKGDADRVSGHFAGTVYPGQTKSLHDEIDTQFYVLEINHSKAVM